MEDSRWLRFVTAGLVLAAIVVAYFLITGRFSANNSQPKQEQQASRPVQQFQSSPTPTPKGGNVGVGTTTPTGGLNDSGITTLPNTGYPAVLIGIFSVSAMISGYYLRRFPR